MTETGPVESALQRFYPVFGEAMSLWSNLERELALVFCRITGMKPDMAARVFFSGRNFKTRIEMLAAALTTSEVPDESGRL